MECIVGHLLARWQKILIILGWYYMSNQLSDINIDVLCFRFLYSLLNLILYTSADYQLRSKPVLKCSSFVQQQCHTYSREKLHITKTNC